MSTFEFPIGTRPLASTLIAMRHAHADSGHDQADELRPLTHAGRQLARTTGRLLTELNVVPDLIVASSAVRTTETANLVAQELPEDPRIVRSSALYLAPAEVYLPVTLDEVRDESTVMVVGHNPGVGLLMRTLSGRRLSVSPGTTCVFSFESDLSDLKGMTEVSATLTQLIVDGAVIS